MIELGNNIYKLRDKIIAGLYISLAIVLAIIAWYHNLLGHYSQILWPALSSPFIFALALVRLFQKADSKDITPYPVLIIISLVVLNSGSILDPLYRQWLYMIPVLTYFILPVRQASISLLLFFTIFVLFVVEQINPLILSDLAINLSLFSGISFIFAYTQESQTRTLESLSGKDSSTGAFSANQLNKRLTAEVARAKATRRPLSALLFTLNDFDDYHSQNGDNKARKLLKRISMTMQEVSRIGDEIYRMTDNSFLLLLPNTSINGCIVLKERLVQRIADQVEIDSILQDLTLNPITLQVSEDAMQFLKRTLSDNIRLNAQVL